MSKKLQSFFFFIVEGLIKIFFIKHTLIYNKFFEKENKKKYVQ
ncbi:hypothetical protein pb186bvf_001561 [Paramecium bursaria]